MTESNDYDSFAADRAKEFATGKNLVHAYIEKPAMYALLPDLKDKSVLCIGCGTGEECAELQRRGAKVTGIDIAPASITHAASHVPEVVFKQVDMDAAADLLALGEGRFDLVYSSLAFHYSDDLDSLLKNLHKLLVPKGKLLFSVGHPLRWAAEVHDDHGTKVVQMGYTQSAKGTKVFGDYLSTKQFTQKLSDGPQVTYWMRPISAYFTLLKKCGYELLDFKEPVPIKEARMLDADFWSLRVKMPVDMVFLAQVQT